MFLMNDFSWRERKAAAHDARERGREGAYETRNWANSEFVKKKKFNKNIFAYETHTQFDIMFSQLSLTHKHPRNLVLVQHANANF